MASDPLSRAFHERFPDSEAWVSFDVRKVQLDGRFTFEELKAIMDLKWPPTTLKYRDPITGVTTKITLRQENYAFPEFLDYQEGKRRLVHIIQDETGNRTIKWSDKFVFPMGVTPVLTTRAGAIDALVFIDRDGKFRMDFFSKDLT